MCGRLNVSDSPFTRFVLDVLGIEFTTVSNADVRPTQTVDTIAVHGSEASQLATTWGIRPAWAKHLLINAQAETVSTKPTFKNAFSTHRCIVPCTGWYEWRVAGGAKKQRYAFTHAGGMPFLMAGIWFDRPTGAKLVTLTTTPAGRCAEIHNRMPLLIDPDTAELWLHGQAIALGPLMAVNRDDHIAIHCDTAQ